MPERISRPGGETPTRSKSSASTGAQAASVFRAQVLAVNTRDYTVDIQYESYPYSTHLDIPWMTPYLHQNQGEGMAVMPEVGSTVWVCQPSESGRDAFVLGWTPVQESGTYRAGRQLLNPGDLHFSTRDGNFVFLRRGGIVQIGATPVCQRLYIPIRNIIRDFAENYELSTPAGDLTWEVMRAEDQGDGHRGCLYTLACKEFSDDPNKDPLAVLKIGSHGDGNDTILSLETRDKGGGSVKTGLTISKSGKVKWTVQDDVTLEIKGNLTSTISKKMTVTSTEDMSLESKAQAFLKAAQIHATGGGAKLDLAGSAALNGTVVNLGDAIGSVVIDNGTLGAWIMAVTALLSGPPSAIAFKGILPPLVYKSTKVKA
jgi:hypothetical protein